jgi:hypothetical protein
MADTAAHLVDRVFPHVPVRQWVLSFPHAFRYEGSVVTQNFFAKKRGQCTE